MADSQIPMAFMSGHISVALAPLSTSVFQPCKFFPTVWSIWNSRVMNFYFLELSTSDQNFNQHTLEFQIDHTVGKNLHGWKNDIDNGARATEMCPDIKAIGIWLSAIENL